MKKALILLFFVLFSFEAKAISITINQDGSIPSAAYGNTTNFSGGTNGISVTTNNASNAWQIAVNDAVTATGNTGAGISATSNGKVVFDGSGGGSLTANGNKNNPTTWTTGYGIIANGASTSITIKNMSVTTNENGLHGLYANNGSIGIQGALSGVTRLNNVSSSGNKTSVGTTGNGIVTGGMGVFSITDINKLTTNNNGGLGVNGTNITIDANEIEANGNGGAGISVGAGSDIDVGKLTANNNGGSGVALAGGATLDVVGGDVSLVNNGSNNGNGHGLEVNGASIVTFTGKTDGSNTFTATDNRKRTTAAPTTWTNGNGLSVAGGSDVTIENMNVVADRNGLYGVFASNGTIDITGALDGIGKTINTLSASGNKTSAGTTGKGIHSLNTAVIHIKNMNITANNNGSDGLSAQSGGIINVTTTANEVNTFSFNNNRGAGIYGYDGGSARSAINITGNGDEILNINENMSASQGGIHLPASSSYIGSELVIKGVQKVNVNQNSGHGMYIDTNGLVSIKNDVQSSLTITGNGKRGIFLHGALLEAENFDVTVTGNVDTGIYGFESNAKIYGNGATKLVSSSNGGSGIDFTGTRYSPNLEVKDMAKIETNSNTASGITGTNMILTADAIEANENGTTGINARAGSKINTNKLTVNNNGGRGVMLSDGAILNVITENDINIKNNNTNAASGYHYGLLVSSGSVANLEGNGITDINLIENNLAVQGAGSQINISKINVNITDAHSWWALSATGKGTLNITGDRSEINTITASGNEAGMLASDHGTINVENMNIVANNNLYGLLMEDASEVNITSTKNNLLQMNNNTGSAIASFSEGNVLNVSGYNIEIINNGNAGITNTSDINIVGNRNTMKMSGNKVGISSDDTYGTGAATSITGMDIISDDDTFALVSKAGTLDLTNTTVDMHANGIVLSTLNDANINIKDSYIHGADILLSTGFVDVQPSNTVELKVGASTVEGVIYTAQDTASNVLLINSTWAMRQSSNITNLTNSASHIDLRSPLGGAYNTLTVNNYAANGGDMYFNTYFDMDGLTTDRLVIDGGVVSGVTTIHVSPTGTDGSSNEEDGIMVVEALNGTTTTDNDFVLYNGVVDSGAYEYELKRGNLDNPNQNSNENAFYLRSNGTPTIMSNTAIMLPAIHYNIVKTGMNQLRKRMGDLRTNSPENDSGLWVRSYGKHLRVDDAIDLHMSLYGVESGYDQKIYSTCDNKVFAGIMAGYIQTDDIRSAQIRTSISKGQANTPSLGAYATWYNIDGWFADATLRHFWVDMNMHTATAQGEVIKYYPDRNFITGSLELGRRTAFVIDDSNRILIEPKAEVQYAFSKAESFRTSTGNDLYYGDTQGLATRLAIATAYSHSFDDGAVVEPFVEAALIKEWDGITRVRYAGANFKSDVGGTSFEFSTGLNAKINNNWSMYSDVAVEFGDVYDAVSTNIGVRYNW